MLNIPIWSACTCDCVVVEGVEPEQKGRTTFFDILSIMEANRFRRLPVVKNKELAGIITTHDLIRALNEASSIMDVFSLEAEQLMTPNPLTISPKSTVVEVAKIMASRKIGCLPIIGKGEKTLRGIITERDFLGFLPYFENKIIRDYCSKNVITIDPSTPLKRAIEIMVDENIRHLILINASG
ncbi:MAG: CBS domain-containing protein, partial [Candidatus Hodarchaeota archaeon]